MTKPEQIVNKIRFSDFDKDGVPNKWDCQPRNFRKQDGGRLQFQGFCPYCGVPPQNFHLMENGAYYACQNKNCPTYGKEVYYNNAGYVDFVKKAGHMSSR
jgi:hypothetical protein